MKKLLYATSLLLCLSNFTFAQKASLNYSINLNDRSDDTFKVILTVGKLSEENNIYQFASTAPGTYQTMNIGRFVCSFKALDKKGREIATEKFGENQYKLSNPKKIKTIEYTIAETWDTPVEELPVYRMCGTSMEDDHVLFNAHDVIGYLSGMQAEPLTIDLQYPSEWKIGTALSKNEQGVYYAKNYDYAVDSPILLGRLSVASVDFKGTKIELFTYSVTDKITSQELLESMGAMLNAANDFVVDFPVDRYTFLFHFEDVSTGAWEHSYSSEYVYSEADYAENAGPKITSTAAHEFFHIITPLNLHSEIIQKFNFVTPTPSQHLWLYEGTTEWASDMMQLRGGLIDLPTLFGELTTKLTYNSYFDESLSLTELSMTSFTKKGQQQYYNIYCRGALTAGLLDIRLLELSNGERGLREVINELSKTYGAENAFSEENFFEAFTNLTYPEISEFFDSYVKNVNTLPLAEYYNKLGISYNESKNSGEKIPTIGGKRDLQDGNVIFSEVPEELKEMGFQKNDIIRAVDGFPLSLGNARQLLSQLLTKKIGDAYTITVLRSDEEIKVEANLLSEDKVENFVFSMNPNATPAQMAMREIWMKNL